MSLDDDFKGIHHAIEKGVKINGVSVSDADKSSPQVGAVEFDAKRLASEILKEIGREMGVSY